MMIDIKKNILIKNNILLLLFFILITGVNSATNITSLPYTINTAGDYQINSNLSTTGHGITITASNVNLTCNGYTISGDNGASDNGIYVNGNRANVNISNCNVRNIGNGILAGSGGTSINYLKILNCNAYNTQSGLALINFINYAYVDNFTSYNSSSAGISLQTTYYSNFSNITIYNSMSGIFQAQGWNNKFENFNIYNNTYGIYLYGTDSNEIKNGDLSNNINYSIYVYAQAGFIAHDNFFYGNNLGNISKIYSMDWALSHNNSFNYSGIGNTYDIGSESPICFDAPANLTCDYFPSYTLYNGTVVENNLNSIFPYEEIKSALVSILLIISYLLWS